MVGLAPCQLNGNKEDKPTFTVEEEAATEVALIVRSKKHKHNAVEINLTIGCVLEKAKVPRHKMALRSHVKLPASWDNLLELVNHNCNYLHCVNKAQRTNKLHHSPTMIRSSHSQES